MKQRKLSDDVKLFIVQGLACFDGLTAVKASVKAEFGIDIPRQQIERYDPTKAAGQALRAKWRAIFWNTRRVCERDMRRIAIAHPSYRLRCLQRLIEKAEERDNLVMVLRLLKIAAREAARL